MHKAVQFSQHNLLKRFFPIGYSCFPCQRLIDHIIVGSFLGFFFCFINLFYKFIFYWCSICQHTELHPVLIPSSAPLSARHRLTPTPRPPPLPPPLVRFPELGVFQVLSPFLIFPTYFFSFSLYSLYFYIPQMNETI